MSDFVQHIQDVVEGKLSTHPFYYFEPWDVEKRARWILDQALKDGIDLNADWFLTAIGQDPHPFQTGYMLSDTFFNGICAATQIGKTYAALVKTIMMMTGELPYAFRHPAGYDTKIKRLVNEQNIIRFGRRDSTTGEIIDYNVEARKPTQWDEWDCGTIIGAGEFPKKLIAPPGNQAWIGTYMMGVEKTWWPRLYEASKLLIPSHFIDKSRGNKGYSVNTNTVYLIRDQKLILITYEAGDERFEQEMAWTICLDEEPEGAGGPKILSSAKTHCRYLSFTLTPYQGVTFTKELFFPQKQSPEYKVWHATRYDCPYHTRQQIEAARVGEKPWLIAARVWGFHAEQTGRPYYDREKINIWIQKYKMGYSVKRMVESSPFFAYGPIPGIDTKTLIDTKVNAIECEYNGKDSWRIYEEPIKGIGYVLSGDPAEGSENPDAAGDTCSAMVMRKPIPERGEERPVICATLRSTLITQVYARESCKAARYYNNAILAMETKRNEFNAIVAGELRSWPHWFKMVVTNDVTQRPRDVRGFDTNAKTRGQIFELIAEWLKSYDKDMYPGIPDENLLVELAACVVGKNGRPDHTTAGSLDTTVCFGINLFVIKYGGDQIKCNVEDEIVIPRESRIRRALRGPEQPNPNGIRLPPWRG